MLKNNNIIESLVLLNGIYDIICGLSIISELNIPFFSKIHLDMMEYKPIIKSYIGYWIFTYGFMRIYNKKMAIYSYLIESIFYCNELINYRLNEKKGIFVIICSINIAIYLYIN